MLGMGRGHARWEPLSEVWHQGGSGEEHPNLVLFSPLISYLTNPMGQRARDTDDALQIALE